MLPAAIQATAEMAIDDIEAGVKGLFKVGQFAPRATRTNDRERTPNCDRLSAALPLGGGEAGELARKRLEQVAPSTPLAA
jgi:hypothetical protein